MQRWTEPTIIPIIVRDALCLAQPVPMYDLILRRLLMGTTLNGSPPFQELTQSAPRRFALLVKPHIVRAKQTKAFNGALIMVNTNIYD